jgi:folylpolyglutamate synthase/dihydropteroate synthase
MPAAELASVITRVTGNESLVVSDVRQALEIGRERGGAAGMIVTGSLYTVGAVKALGADIP